MLALPADVFYTNSRYAKVGGLPQSELNQLELQFLLLNDFNLAIPLEEMQRYGDQLLLYSQNAAAAEVCPNAPVSLQPLVSTTDVVLLSFVHPVSWAGRKPKSLPRGKARLMLSSAAKPAVQPWRPSLPTPLRILAAILKRRREVDRTPWW